MAKPKQLWNVSGVLKSFTDASGLYQVVEPWDPVAGGGGIKVDPADMKRLLDNGFTDQDPNPTKKKAAAAAAATVADAPAEEGG